MTSRRLAISQVISSHRVCGGSGDLLCLDLNLAMRFILFAGTFDGWLTRIVSGAGSGSRVVGSVVVPRHVVPSKKVIGLGSRWGRTGWSPSTIGRGTFVWGSSVIPPGRVEVAASPRLFALCDWTPVFAMCM
ncbi:hypothetical protein PMIN01_13371 [Paraphaeosphaeria minitans]|uniref:Uncharacterized protein n=1 Tax=Paraphaeosphaeria minitans TaxID=565426 RepID=A0A9P6KIQ3_9PLEO|nr:hypothetical protein PMIN01_13371 [Paraphaeosphaeria minitans]